MSILMWWPTALLIRFAGRKRGWDAYDLWNFLSWRQQDDGASAGTPKLETSEWDEDQQLDPENVPL